MPYLDKTTPKDFGKIKPVGTNEHGNKIYALGTKNSKMGNMLNDLANIQGISDQYTFISTTKCVNLILRIGGCWAKSRTISRRLMLYQMGENLSADRNQTDKTPDQVIAAKPYP